jgi:hypothetical protein
VFYLALMPRPTPRSSLHEIPCHPALLHSPRPDAGDQPVKDFVIWFAFLKLEPLIIIRILSYFLSNRRFLPLPNLDLNLVFNGREAVNPVLMKVC